MDRCARNRARQILQKLVVGRPIFTPKTENGVAFYEFSGSRSWPASYPPL
jgi:hypothetical protein